MKRALDILVSFFGLAMTSPIIIPVLILVWLQDFKSPFYVAPRVGLGGKIFKMVKVRSMVVKADQTGVDSTSSNDPRITPVGRFVRRFKVDEITQLWNVLKGDMSLVGPRPNVERDVALYTKIEKNLLSIKPGITDFSSIVFSDEGEILKGYPDPDLSYNQLIRPWKSRLGLLYIDKQSLILDIQLILLTAMAIVSKENSLREIEKILIKLKTDEELRRVALRCDTLVPHPPPGSTQIAMARY
jgi:lipopolysaccharide/colanic/teichoic acid biosynthesis glycosyltransferase